jgi:OmpA-OmpF porin, OOP family
MKKQIIIYISLTICILLQAQKSENLLNFSIGGGQHNLSYSLKDGIQTPESGFTANVAFTHYFTPKLGLLSGVGIQTFGSVSTLNLTESTPAIDSDMDIYVHNAKFNNWQEKQQVLFVEIPVAGQFKHRINDKINLQLTLGAKLSLPLSSTFKTTGGELITSGYYPQYNIELTDLPNHGFSTITQSFSGKNKLNPLFSAISKLGLSYKLTEKIDIYAGGYFNYGLNNILKADTKLLYQQGGTYNSVFQTNQTTSIKPVAFGFELGLNVEIGKK